MMLALVLALPAGAATDSHAELRAAVAELATSLSDGYATLDRNDVVILGSPASSQAAVLFALTGFGKGNGSTQYLAFYSRNEALPGDRQRKRPYRLLALSTIGERGWRLFDPSTAQFRDGAVDASGRAYLPKDAMCCPSQAIQARFAVSHGRITESAGNGP